MQKPTQAAAAVVKYVIGIAHRMPHTKGITMRIKTITQDHAANGVDYYIVLDVHHWGIEATVHNMGSDEFREHKFVDYSVDEVLDICRNAATF